MVFAWGSGSIDLGLNPRQCYCVVFLEKRLVSGPAGMPWG